MRNFFFLHSDEKIEKLDLKYTVRTRFRVLNVQKKREKKGIRGNWSQITCNLGLAYQKFHYTVLRLSLVFFRGKYWYIVTYEITF